MSFIRLNTSSLENGWRFQSCAAVKSFNGTPIVILASTCASSLPDDSTDSGTSSSLSGGMFSVLDAFSNNVVSTCETNGKMRHLAKYHAHSGHIIASAGHNLSLIPLSPHSPELAALAMDRVGSESNTPSVATIRLSASDSEVLAKLLAQLLASKTSANTTSSSLGFGGSNLGSVLAVIKNSGIHEILVKKLEALRHRSKTTASCLLSSNHHNIAIEVPRAAFLALCNGLLNPPVVVPETSIPVLASVLEQLHWSPDGSRLQVYGVGQKMHVEYIRIRSFDGASVSAGSEHLNDAFAAAVPQIAAAGFYFEPSQSETSGFCVHFETGASVPTIDCDSFRGLISDAWAELEKLCVSSCLLTGRPSENVPLSVSISAMSAMPFIGSEFSAQEAAMMIKRNAHITSISVPVCSRTSLVATSSSNGILSVWTTSISQSTSSPSLAYCIDTISYQGDLLIKGSDSEMSSNSELALDELTTLGIWTCSECETENDPSTGFGERCEMCDTMNPNWKEASTRFRQGKLLHSDCSPQLAQWMCRECETGNQPSLLRCEMCDSVNPNPTISSVVSSNDMNGGLFENFMCLSGISRRLAAVEVIPLPLLDCFDEEKQSNSEDNLGRPCRNPRACPESSTVPDPGLNWADGWAAENICVHIVKGVYSGTDATIVSTGVYQCQIRTAFDSVEPVTADMIEPKPPSSKDKRVKIIKVSDKKQMHYKGQTGVVVRITGKEATIKFKVSDPPSKHFTTQLTNLAELDKQVQQQRRIRGKIRTSNSQSTNIIAEGTVVAIVAGNGVLGIRLYNQVLGDSVEKQFLFCDSVPPQTELDGTTMTNSLRIDTDKPILSAFHRESNMLLVGVTAYEDLPGSEIISVGAVLCFSYDHKYDMIKYAGISERQHIDTDKCISSKADVSFCMHFELSDKNSESHSDSLSAMCCVPLSDNSSLQKHEALVTLSSLGKLSVFYNSNSLSLLGNQERTKLLTLVRSCELTMSMQDTKSRFVDVCRVSISCAPSLNNKTQNQNSSLDGPLHSDTLMKQFLDQTPDIVVTKDDGHTMLIRNMLIPKDQVKNLAIRSMSKQFLPINGINTSTVPFPAENKIATIQEVKALEAHMKWRKLCFIARGPRGVLSCSSSPSGTDMRWRAQTAYGNALWSKTNPKESKLRVNASKTTLWTCCCPPNGLAWRNTTNLDDRFSGGRGPEYKADAHVIEERIGPDGNWLKCTAGPTFGIKFLPIALNGEVVMFPKTGTQSESFKCVASSGVAYCNSPDLLDIYYLSNGHDLRVECNAVITSTGPIAGDWIKVNVNGHGMKYLAILKKGELLFKRTPLKKQTAEQLFQFQPFQGNDHASSEAKIKDSHLSAPPLLRQHSDLLGARASADAHELQWEINLREDCILGLLKVCLELQTEELTKPQQAALFDGSGSGVICPLHESGRMFSSKDYSLEAWVRLQNSSRPDNETHGVDNIEGGEMRKHEADTFRPRTILVKSTTGAQGSVPQFELLVHPNGALQFLIYTQSWVSGEPSQPVQTSLNKKTSFWLTADKWNHVAVTVSAMVSGRTEVCLYVNGDFVSVDYFSLDKYRPIVDWETDPVGPLWIGCSGLNGVGFFGNIRYVRYWKGTRTQSDIRDSMHCSSPILVSSSGVSRTGDMQISTMNTLVGQWPLTGKLSFSEGSHGAQFTTSCEFSDFTRANAANISKYSHDSASILTWSAKLSSKMLDIPNSGSIVICTKRNFYQTAIANEGFTEGVHYWEIHVLNAVNSSNLSTKTLSEMFVGVGEKGIAVDNCFVGQHCHLPGKRGWGYYSRSGKYAEYGGRMPYGQTFGKQGDIIGVTLDCDSGTLRYSVNGKDQGIAESKGLKGLKLYPCVSLFTPSSPVQILITASSMSTTKHGYFSGMEGAVERAEMLQTHATISNSKAKIPEVSNNAGKSEAASKGAEPMHMHYHLSPQLPENCLQWELIPTPYMDFAPLLQLSVYVQKPEEFLPLGITNSSQNSRHTLQTQSLVISENLDSSNVSLELGGSIGRRLVVRLRRFSRDRVSTKFKMNSLKLSIHGRKLSPALPEQALQNMSFFHNGSKGVFVDLISRPALYPTNRCLRERLFKAVCSTATSSQVCCIALKILEEGIREFNISDYLVLLQSKNNSETNNIEDSNLAKIINKCILLTHDVDAAQAVLSFLQRISEFNEDDSFASETRSIAKQYPCLGDFVISLIVRILPKLHEKAVSAISVSSILKLMHLFWDHASSLCLESSLRYIVHLAKILETRREQESENLRQTGNLRSPCSKSPSSRMNLIKRRPLAYSAHLLRSMLNTHTCLIHEAFWPLGARAGMCLAGKISHCSNKNSSMSKPSVKHSMQTNFVSVDWKITTSSPVETFINFGTPVLIDRISLPVAKSSHGNFSARVELSIRDGPGATDIHADNSKDSSKNRNGTGLSEWKPVYIITLSPSDSTNYIRARYLQSAPPIMLASQIRITIQCTNWSQAVRFSSLSPPQIVKECGVKFMLCVYGRDNYLTMPIDILDRQQEELKNACQYQFEQVNKVRSKLTSTINTLKQLQHTTEQNKDGLLPHNLFEIFKDANMSSRSLTDYHSGSCKDEIEMLHIRKRKLEKLAKCFPKQKKGPFFTVHPIADLLIKLGDQLSTLTQTVADYQKLRYKSESIRILISEFKRDSKKKELLPRLDIIPSFWESSMGQILFTASEIIQLLMEKESEGGSFVASASGNNFGIVSTCSPNILSISECKTLFLSFAVYFPTNENLASNLTVLIRNICMVRCSNSNQNRLPDFKSQCDDAAGLPRNLLLATLGAPEMSSLHMNSSELWPFHKEHVFDLIYEIAYGSSSTTTSYSVGPLVETVTSGKANSPQSLSFLGWTLLLLSRILDQKKSDEVGYSLKANGAPRVRNKSTRVISDIPIKSTPQRFVQTLNFTTNSRVVHPGTRCAITNMSPIVGPRYFCITRADFEICESAWKDPANATMFWNDVFIKLNRPLPLPPNGSGEKKQETDGSGTMDTAYYSSDEDVNHVALEPLIPDFYNNFEKSKAGLSAYDGELYDGERKNSDKPLPLFMTNYESSLQTSQNHNRFWNHTCLHVGVFCDNEDCTSPNNEIRGVRFLSVVDDSYNLCEACEQAGVADSRVPAPIFIALRRPLPPPSKNENPSALLPDRSKLESLLNLPSSKRAKRRRRMFRTPKSKKPKQNIEGVSLFQEQASVNYTNSSQVSRDIDKETKQSSRTMNDAESMAQPGLMSTIFSLLASPQVLMPLHLELLILATRVFCQFTFHVNPCAVAEVLEHPKLEFFLQMVAATGEPFAHSAATRLFTALLNLAASHSDSMSGKPVSQCDSSISIDEQISTPFNYSQLERTRLVLRDAILDVLSSQSSGQFDSGGYAIHLTAGLTQASFLLELLIVVLSEQPIAAHEATSIQKVQDFIPGSVKAKSYQASNLASQSPSFTNARKKSTSQRNQSVAKLPAAAARRLLVFMTSSPFRSEEVALTWNSCFRLIYKFCNAIELLSSPNFSENFNNVLYAALVSPRNLASVVENDILRVLSFLFAVSKDCNPSLNIQDKTVTKLFIELRKCVTSAAVDTFNIASRLNGSFFSRVLAVVRENISTTRTCEGISAAQLGSLLVGVSQVVITEAGDATVVTDVEMHVMCEAIRYINAALNIALCNKNEHEESKHGQPFRSPLRLDFLRHIMGSRSLDLAYSQVSKSGIIAAQRLLEWLSTANNHKDNRVGELRSHLGDELVNMFCLIMTEQEDSEVPEVYTFIDLLVKVLRMSSSNIAPGYNSRILHVALNTVRANRDNAMYFSRAILSSALKIHSEVYVTTSDSVSQVNSHVHHLQTSSAFSNLSGHASSISRAITKVLSPSTNASIYMQKIALSSVKNSNSMETNIAPRCEVLSICNNDANIVTNAMQVFRILKEDTNQRASSLLSKSKYSSISDSLVDIKWSDASEKKAKTHVERKGYDTWSTVIMLPEDAVIRSVDISFLKDTKLSKIGIAQYKKGKRSVLPSKVEILVGASESHFRLVGTYVFEVNKEESTSKQIPSSGEVERIRIKAMGHAAVRFLKIVMNKNIYNGPLGFAHNFPRLDSEISLMSNICITATTLSNSFHQKQPGFFKHASLETNAARDGGFESFSPDELCMQVLYEAFRSFSSIPHALARSTELFRFSVGLPKKVIRMLVPKIADSKIGLNSSRILAMVASTDIDFLRQVVKSIFRYDRNRMLQCSEAFAALAGKLCCLDFDSFLMLWEFVGSSLSSIVAHIPMPESFDYENMSKLMPFFISLAGAICEHAKRGTLPSNDKLREGLSILLHSNEPEDPILVHMENLVQLSIFMSGSIGLISDERLEIVPNVRSEASTLHIAPRALLCSLVQSREDLRSLVMSLVFRHAIIDPQTNFEGKLKESPHFNSPASIYQYEILPIVGILIGAYEPLLRANLAWMKCAADFFLCELKLYYESALVSVESLYGLINFIEMFTGIAHTGAGKEFLGKSSGILERIISVLSRVEKIDKFPSGCSLDEKQHLKYLSDHLLFSGTQFVQTAWNLSLENQEITTTCLIDSLSDIRSLNYFVKELLVSSLTLSETVCISVEHNEDKHFELSPQDRNILWINNHVSSRCSPNSVYSTSYLGPKVGILFGNSNDDCFNGAEGLPKELTFQGRQIKYSHGGINSFRTATARDPFVSGCHEWKITLDVGGNAGNMYDVFIGVTRKKALEASKYCGSDKSSWGYYGSNGYAYHHSTSKSYGKKYKVGDTILVRLDCDAGTLGFSVNGEDQGVAFKNLNASAYYPCISLYCPGDTVSVVYVRGDYDGGGSILDDSAGKITANLNDESFIWPPLSKSLFSSAQKSLTLESVPIEMFRTSNLDRCSVEQNLGQIMCAYSALGATWYLRLPGHLGSSTLLHKLNPLMTLRDARSLAGNQEILDLCYHFESTELNSDTSKSASPNENHSHALESIQTYRLPPGQYEWKGQYQNHVNSDMSGLVLEISIDLNVFERKTRDTRGMVLENAHGFMSFTLVDVPKESKPLKDRGRTSFMKDEQFRDIFKCVGKSIAFHFDLSFVDSECQIINDHCKPLHLLLQLDSSPHAMKRALAGPAVSHLNDAENSILSRFVLGYVGRTFIFACSSMHSKQGTPTLIAGSAINSSTLNANAHLTTTLKTEIAKSLREPTIFAVAKEHTKFQHSGFKCYPIMGGIRTFHTFSLTDALTAKVGGSDASSSPMLIKIAKMDGLSKLLALVKDQIWREPLDCIQFDSNKRTNFSEKRTSSKKIASYDTYERLTQKSNFSNSHKNNETASQKNQKKERQQMWRWLSALEGNIALPGFAEAFLTDNLCVVLLLKALGVDEIVKGNNKELLGKPRMRLSVDQEGAMKQLLRDPLASQVSALTTLFRKHKVDWRHSDKGMLKTCLESGVIDRLLLRIGELQGEEPRDSTWTEKYEDPIVVRTRRVKKEMLKPEDKNTTLNDGGESKESSALWKPGYGHGNSSFKAADEERRERMKQKMKSTIQALKCFAAFLEIPNEHATQALSGDDWVTYVKIIDASPILKVFMSYLFGNSTSSVLDKPQLYSSILRCVLAMSLHPELAELLGKLPGLYKSLEELMLESKDLVDELEEEDEDGDKSEKKSLQRLRSEAQVKKLFRKTIAQVEMSMLLWREKCSLKLGEKANGIYGASGGESKSSTEIKDGNGTSDDNIETVYVDIMSKMLFKSRDLNYKGGPNPSHHYKKSITADKAGAKKRTSKLKKELKQLKKSLPIHFGSSIFLRVDQSRPYVMQAMITGPNKTPYDSGCFQFDIYCTNAYPKEPPKVNLETTGSGSVRFNPNLYNCGKVCLSLLGTWQGGAKGNENWTKKSSIWQVLVSIQGQILGSEYPYFNEPSIEAQWGTATGRAQCRVAANGGYERLRVATIQHAMIGQIRHPSAGFEDVVREHFRLKGPYIVSQIEGWIEEAKSSPTSGHKKALEKQLKKLKEELAKLGDPPSAAVKKYEYIPYKF